MWRDDAYLLDMLLAARKVRDFTLGISRDKFLSDDLTQNAVVHCIQIIGEAASKISKEYRQEYPEIPWQGIIGMRDRIVHEYFDIIPEQVWEVVEKDIPKLIKLIEPLVPPDENSSTAS